MINKEALLNGVYERAFEDELLKIANSGSILQNLKGSFGAIGTALKSQSAINTGKKTLKSGKDFMRENVSKYRTNNAAAKELATNNNLEGTVLQNMNKSTVHRNLADESLHNIRESSSSIKGIKQGIGEATEARKQALKKALPAVGVVGTTGIVGATGLHAIANRPR